MDDVVSGDRKLVVVYLMRPASTADPFTGELEDLLLRHGGGGISTYTFAENMRTLEGARDRVVGAGCPAIARVAPVGERFVPLSVREGGWRKRFGWRVKGAREAVALALAPWLRRTEGLWLARHWPGAERRGAAGRVAPEPFETEEIP